MMHDAEYFGDWTQQDNGGGIWGEVFAATNSYYSTTTHGLLD